MLTLEIISLLIFVLYLFFTIRYVGHIPESLSETYYLLGDKYYKSFPDPSEMSFHRLRASIFTAMMWAIALLLMIPLLELTPEPGKPLVFLSLASIMLVGAAPQFHDEMEGRVHTISAYSAAVLGILWSVIFAHGIYCLAYFVAVCLIASLITGTVKSCRTYWLEMIAFGTVYASAILQTL